MKKAVATAQVKKGGSVVSEVKFEYDEASSNAEAERLAKRHYKCSLFGIFNRYHRMKEIDKARRTEALRLQDPLRNLKKEVRKMLKLADERSLQDFLDSVERR